MVRERIADDVYVFTSQSYAGVTAGAILTDEGAILIDTLFYPEETQAIQAFLEQRLGYPVRYVITTHYHADHTQGTHLFPEAQVVSHALCRRMLDTVGRKGLAKAQEQSPELNGVEIVLPTLVFEEGTLTLHLGRKSVRLHHMPGHSPDLISVHIPSHGILFASDNAMPVPTFFDGSYEDLVRSLTVVREMAPQFLVQGHGEVILRGAMGPTIREDLTYLRLIKEMVGALIASGKPAAALQEIDIEQCGKSRIPLNGLVTDLHRANLFKLYQQMQAESQAAAVQS